MKSELSRCKSNMLNGLWAALFVGPHSILFILFFSLLFDFII